MTGLAWQIKYGNRKKNNLHGTGSRILPTGLCVKAISFTENKTMQESAMQGDTTSKRLLRSL